MRLAIGLLFLGIIVFPACVSSENNDWWTGEWSFSECSKAYDELQTGLYPCLSYGDSCQAVLDVPCGEGCRRDRHDELQRQFDLKKAIIKNCHPQYWFPED